VSSDVLRVSTTSLDTLKEPNTYVLNISNIFKFSVTTLGKFQTCNEVNLNLLSLEIDFDRPDPLK
jgi:hypothetical protein